MELHKLGFTNSINVDFQQYRADNCFPARVTREDKELYHLISEYGECKARISGKFRFNSSGFGDFPVVGDWVVVKKHKRDEFGQINAVLPRKSSFSRKAVLRPGKTDRQVLAANIDFIFIVTSLDTDFNPRRIERYISISWDSGASPIIILNKSDLCDDIEEKEKIVGEIAFGVPCHSISAKDNLGLDCFAEYLQTGKTGVLLGSSGVGKSSIINALLNTDELKTGNVRSFDNKGRHTTTWREMIVLPQNGILIDTPGMREIQAWDDDQGIGRTFDDIDQLATQCKFNDCNHSSEPGCAILASIENGELDEKRFKSYLKLQREADYMRRQTDQKARITEQNKWKQITKQIRKYYKNKR